MAHTTTLWQVTPDGVREVTGHPTTVDCLRWQVTPVAGGEQSSVHVGDLAATDLVALLMWHERQGRVGCAETVEARIKGQYVGAREVRSLRPVMAG